MLDREKVYVLDSDAEDLVATAQFKSILRVYLKEKEKERLRKSGEAHIKNLRTHKNKIKIGEITWKKK